MHRLIGKVLDQEEYDVHMQIRIIIHTLSFHHMA